MAVRPSKARIEKEKIPRFEKPEISENQITAAKTLKSERFQKLCQEAGIPATKRQAAKFNRRSGRWVGVP